MHQDTLDSIALDAAQAAAHADRLVNGETCPRCGQWHRPTGRDLDLDLGSGVICWDCRVELLPSTDCPVCGAYDWAVVIETCTRAGRVSDRLRAVCVSCDAETGSGPIIDLGPLVRW